MSAYRNVVLDLTWTIKTLFPTKLRKKKHPKDQVSRPRSIYQYTTTNKQARTPSLYFVQLVMISNSEPALLFTLLFGLEFSLSQALAAAPAAVLFSVPP